MTQRQLFDLPASPIYLSAASRSPMPRRVVEIGTRALRRKMSCPWSIAATSDQEIEETVRNLWAKLLNAPGGANDMAYTPSCSYAISVAANVILASDQVHAGDDILVLSDQMSSNVYPWQDLANKTGATVRAVILGDAVTWTDAILTSCWWQSDTVKVLAVPNVHWCDGALLDLVKIGSAAKSHGVILVVDATQSLGAYPLDVQAVNPDFVAASAHKWLMGPYGVCLLYVAAQWQQQSFAAPLEYHEHNRVGADGDTCLPMLQYKVKAFTGYEERYKMGARRFDSGGRPNPVLLPMVCEALKMVLAWDPQHIHVTLTAMTTKIGLAAGRLGLSIPAQHGGHIVGISKKHDSEWADRCSTFLKSRGVIIASRFGKLRVAPHLYNTQQEIHLFCTLLKEFVYQDSIESKL
jgi:selenocysteine lyase/cysteine desulfurase